MIEADPAGYVGSSVQSIESKNYFSICYQKIVEFCIRIWHLTFNFFKSKSVILSDDAGELQRDKSPFIEVFKKFLYLKGDLVLDG